MANEEMAERVFGELGFPVLMGIADMVDVDIQYSVEKLFDGLRRRESLRHPIEGRTSADFGGASRLDSDSGEQGVVLDDQFKDVQSTESKTYDHVV